MEMATRSDGSPECSRAALVSMQDISKSFGENRVLRGISFDVYPGEVHALLGGNGAGKSTLMKVLMGVYAADAGRIFLNGKDISGESVQEHLAQGIAMIFQELSLLPNLTVAQNLFLGREPRKPGWRIDSKRLNEEARALIEQYRFGLKAHDRVGTLGFAQRQMVEILKAISRGAKVLVMDEPTSSLSLREETQLFKIIEELQSRGLGIVYISHRMAEVFRLAQRISIIKDGQVIGPLDTTRTSMPEVASLMSTQEADVAETVRPASRTIDRSQPVLRVEGLRTKRKLDGLTFEIASGEVLGVCGLVGSGRSTLAKALFGLLDDVAGRFIIDGKPLKIGNPAASIAAGIGFVPEDRRLEGLVLSLGLSRNVTMAKLAARIGPSWLSNGWGESDFAQFRQKLNINCRRASQLVAELSGGNQQKVVFAKWLATRPRLLILDEPTNGVDVNAKAEMRAAIRAATAQGIAVLLISSELDELVMAADRVILMVDGHITRELSELGSEADLHTLLQVDIAAVRDAGQPQDSAI
ncbi:MAG: sugar ABC transporter ATP-binding protein [Ancalomicrobiaceae bacterium]|nr:sugar ABC transporter ATP-binding protein [Ancalomicrobiaceae bacterium]